MGQLRHIAHRHRQLALWLVAFALALGAIVPRGYMLAPGKSFTITLCTGTGPAMMQVDIPMDPGDSGKAPDDRGKAMACPYAGHAPLGLGATDPILLVGAIAFVMALGFAPALTPPIDRESHFQPPPIGPPARI